MRSGAVFLLRRSGPKRVVRFALTQILGFAGGCLVFVTFGAAQSVGQASGAPTQISASAAAPAMQTGATNTTKSDGLAPIRQYILAGWDTLTRSLSECSNVVDPKLAASESVLYFPADFSVPAEMTALQKRCSFQIKHLPAKIKRPGEIDPGTLSAQGLLYLNHPYVVPGGRFNEMYGWDSYFIIRGLVRDGKIELARGMVENFFFEIEQYGEILNANRSYYLSRSQPPFLTSMILSVNEAQKAAGHEDRAWLERAYGYAVRDHDMWTREPLLAGDTGLSRYFDLGEGPSPESVKDETGHYRDVAQYFLLHPEAEQPYGAPYVVAKDEKHPEKAIFGLPYQLQVCDTARTMAKGECSPAETVSLSGDFYKGDRSMRESGFDIAFRFGAYGAGTHHYAPVCLNSLLYKTEKDLEAMSAALGKKEESERWNELAAQRQSNIQKYLWDAGRGRYFDYDFEKKQRSTYDYITTFYPLWAGLATKEQAAQVASNLEIFERAGGMMMSPYETGGQWDAPYVWAPTELLAVDGLRRYGINNDANRVAYKFLSTVAENFRRDGTIREKYNAETRSSETAVTAGYHMNIVGFGWTNGAFVDLLHDLPGPLVEKLAKEQEHAANLAQ
jgi:alpha,alpha-trehalase